MTEPEVSEPDVPLNEDKDTCWLTDLDQGNLLKGKALIKIVFTYVLFSVAHFL